MAGKQDDYGYFGKGIDGYVHYKQAFDRNFSENGSYQKGKASNYHQTSKSNVAPKTKSSPSTSNKHSEPAQTVNGRTYKPVVRTAKDCDKTKRLKNENPYNHPRQNENQQKPNTTNNAKNIFMILLVFCLVMSAIMIVPYLLGFLLTGSSFGADSFGGILILVVGIILIFFL